VVVAHDVYVIKSLCSKDNIKYGHSNDKNIYKSILPYLKVVFELSKN